LKIYCLKPNNSTPMHIIIGVVHAFSEEEKQGIVDHVNLMMVKLFSLICFDLFVFAIVVGCMFSVSFQQPNKNHKTNDEKIYKLTNNLKYSKTNSI
jgi:hypothetical protein